MQHPDVRDGTTIRYPSIANLLIDSADRNTDKYPKANEFSIQRPYSLLNGIFTRLATTEVVLEWDTPNFGLAGFSGTIQYGTPTDQYILVLPTGFFTVEEAIYVLVAALNSESATSNIDWVLSANAIGGAVLTQSGSGAGDVTIAQNPGSSLNLIEKLFGVNPISSTGISNPLSTLTTAIDLRPYRYIDIVSQSLTYAQDVKDSSSAEYVRDVLCRWYFDYDEQNMIDAFGYPILMGYKPFCLRRIFNPPKQIKWDSNLPVAGVMDFAMYNPAGSLVETVNSTNFLITIQVSEN